MGLEQDLLCFTFETCSEDAPGTMAELVVKYRLDADDLSVKDLVTHRDFLAQRLSIPEYLLQVLSWRKGSVVITYWIVRDALPLVELALCRDDVQKKLHKHGVEAVYLDNHPSEQPNLVRSKGWSVIIAVWCNHGTASSSNAGGPITADCTS